MPLYSDLGPADSDCGEAGEDPRASRDDKGTEERLRELVVFSWVKKELGGGHDSRVQIFEKLP